VSMAEAGKMYKARVMMKKKYKHEKDQNQAAATATAVTAAAPPRVAAADPDAAALRIRGWLKHLWKKATTEDDWSEKGNPHPWWDKYSGPPMSSFQRFDLHEASYPLGLLAEKTPAWREVYANILDKLTERYITFWGAVDWLTQFGDDPNRGAYPKAWKGTVIPQEFFGVYNTPGWTANGIGAKGVEADPIRAEGMLFFKGFLLLLMSMTTRVGGADRWKEKWQMAGVGGTKHDWTLANLARHLSEQWSERECGLH